MQRLKGCLFVFSHSTKDEHEPQRAVFGRKQAERSAGLGPVGEPAEVQLQHPDSGPEKQSHTGLRSDLFLSPCLDWSPASVTRRLTRSVCFCSFPQGWRIYVRV